MNRHVWRGLGRGLLGLWCLLLWSACGEAPEEPQVDKESPAPQAEARTLKQALGACNEISPPRYRGAPVQMDTRSYGGGYSLAYDEYWYPLWSGSEVARYNRDHEFLGTFNSGRDQIMQIAGDTEGNYYTANWGHRSVAKWQGRTATEIWKTDLTDIVGGVAIGEDGFIYAMAHVEPTLWKINAETGALVETIMVPQMANTLHGGLAISKGVLYVARHRGSIYRINLSTRQLIDSFDASVNISSLSFDGHELCVSPRTDSVFCYEICNDPLEPVANSQQLTMNVNQQLNITLTGADDNNRALTYEIVRRPEHGSLTGTAPNLTYSPINEYVGFDNFTFRVNNGVQDSPPVGVNINILPQAAPQDACDRLPQPRYRGSVIEMNTRSHGGGYSPAYGEYWYPQWSGTEIHRYDNDHNYIGSFFTGRDTIMQLWGERDGTYLTAHWEQNIVSRWQGLSSSLIWSLDLDTAVGGVTSDDQFVYAMGISAPTVWKINKTTGTLVEQFDLAAMPGVLYGGLALIDGHLYVARHNGPVYVFDITTREQISTFNTNTTPYNTSFNGTDLCFSPNSDQLFCYEICDDTARPRANTRQLSVRAGESVSFTLTGSDPDNRPLTYEIVTRPEHGSLTGTAPNLSYAAINGYKGFDSFTFKVANDNGQESSTVAVNIAVLPANPIPQSCQIVNPPEFRGGLINMETYSHGGGYSPAFEEYWYPGWAGYTVYRYNKNFEFQGTFNSGDTKMMQLWGDADGTYFTAHWDSRRVSRWQVLGGVPIWSTDLTATVGGVTADANFVYAMDYLNPVLWKLNKMTGALIETINLPAMEGVTYGGLAVINNFLYVGRHTGKIYRFDISNNFELLDDFNVDSYIYNMSFNGRDICVSPNSNTMYCYVACEDTQRPYARSLQRSTSWDQAVSLTLSGTDPQNRALTYTILSQPEHGTLTGTAPNLTFTPVVGYSGFDSFTFKVNNGLQDSSPVRVSLTILPPEQQTTCTPVTTPRFRGGTVTMNTRSHGGGYSPAFDEYWYPIWSSTTVYRYNKDHEFIGTFNSGYDQIMQLWGEQDGSYLTANWARNRVARWQGLGNELIWSLDLPGLVGGVTSDNNFAYAIHATEPTLWKINKETGALVDTITLESLEGTSYGGLMVQGDILYTARHHGRVYRLQVSNNFRQLPSPNHFFQIDTYAYNSSFDGREWCFSPNSDDLYCYTMCQDNTLPTGSNQLVSVLSNASAQITLQASDPQSRPLTWKILEDPGHGSLTGTAPNLTYTPVTNYVGFDKFTFKVSNGTQDSVVYSVSVNVLPGQPQAQTCDPVTDPINTLTVQTMNTHSHGGGYSPAYKEYWYPTWSGTTINRYNEDREFIGTFTTGIDQVMQLWGDIDGTYYTANWDRRKVARWHGLSDELIWSTDMGAIVGGVAVDDQFAWAMHYTEPTLWKLNKNTGALIETITVDAMEGTLYGGLAIVNGVLYIGRNAGRVYRLNLTTRQMISPHLTLSTFIYNAAFDGKSYCASPNTDEVSCYNLCRDTARPVANTQTLSTAINQALAVTLSGSDPNNRALTWEILERPEHGSLTGTAPNLTYTPLQGYTGDDTILFRVHNGVQHSANARINITIRPNTVVPACTIVDTPIYRGAPVTMETHSHGGGFSPAFNEYWYPHWAGFTINRFDRNHGFLGTFESGFGYMMQLWGESDGSYYTAHWDRYRVSRWQGLGQGLYWSRDMGDYVGGVAADSSFVYAMHYTQPTVWKLNKNTGALVETFTLPSMEGTLYGGLAIVNGKLYVGRHTGKVYRVNLSTRQIENTFNVATNIYSLSFNGNELCISNNTADLHCYTVCQDGQSPVANPRTVSTNQNTAVAVTLTGSDPQSQPLTYTILQQPANGALTGTAPNLTYTPETGFVGADLFTFQVSDGTNTSQVARVSITVLPAPGPPVACDRANPPVGRNGPIQLNTRSHGGGYSPAFGEYWYPQWAGAAIYRFNKDLRPVGVFNSGVGEIMQLWGDTDGTYYTANWGRKTVSRWSALGSTALWTVDMGEIVGGVAADANFVYAMPYNSPTLWKLNKSTGALIETITTPTDSNTLYGGLAVVDGMLLVGKANGKVYRLNTSNMSLIDTFETGTYIYSSSFDGKDYCVSANTDRLYCFNICRDTQRPEANNLQVSVPRNTPVTATLTGSDPQNSPITYTVLSQPAHGTLTGTAPNLTYTPLTDYVGFDSFTFKVSDGSRDSQVALVTLTILPPQPPPVACDPVDPPEYVGSPILQDTRSYGGGYSPAFKEYWYPTWAGLTVHRYNEEHEYIGSFNSGLTEMMQIWGEDDGTYLTANWGRRKIGRWRGLSADALWIADTDDTVGGVTSDSQFVYAMHASQPIVWKYNKQTGAFIESFTLNIPSETLYGGLALIDGVLYISRYSGKVWRVDINTRQVIDSFDSDTTIQNMVYTGTDLCYSPNSNFIYCYTTCRDATRPSANAQQVSATTGQDVAITLTASDPQDRALTWEIIDPPTRGTLTGTAPNLTYRSLNNYVGLDSFTFRVNNGLQDSFTVAVDLTVRPTGVVESPTCDLVSPPTYRGGPATMNTHSHGGGYSPAFKEYWYPGWSGAVVNRYDENHRYLGTFEAGLYSIMQIWGEADGTFLTAHWSLNKVGRWQGLSKNAIWTTDLGDIVGGVTSDDQFVYALHYSRPTLWKLNKQTGALLETLTLPTMEGITYGGLALVDGTLYVARNTGLVYRIDMDTLEQQSTFTTATYIYNTSFNGQELCFSPNTDSIYCYRVCRDPDQPAANGAQVSTRAGTPLNITLTGSDPQDRPLTWTILARPAHGTLTGTAPNLVYTPINSYVGFDSLSFRVNNGVKDSPTVRVTISVLPQDAGDGACTLLPEPAYRGSPTRMNTHSHGGGYSPAFQEYWYPEWAGTRVFRYDREHRLIGSFTSGRGAIMQLWGDLDGTYYTAHWTQKKVARWLGLSDVALWTTDIPDVDFNTPTVVGGVTADANFAYAMHHAEPIIWKLNKNTGELLQTITVTQPDGLPRMEGTNYGGLLLTNNTLYVARSNGRVYRINTANWTLLGDFPVATEVYNFSFNGQELCVSANTDSIYCYSLCQGPARPTAQGQNLSTRVNTALAVTLAGNDGQNRPLTYELLSSPEHGSLTGTAPNLTYTPINEYVGRDSFSFRVRAGDTWSVAATVSVATLPQPNDPLQCDNYDSPRYRGAPIKMDTRSYGGGYSPAFQEFWYPEWSGRVIHRYDRDYNYRGSFLGGRRYIMQIWGETDGTYYTAHWSDGEVSRWEAMSDTVIWTTDLGITVGGVAADANFVYAMDANNTNVYRLNKATGQLLETFTFSGANEATLYGGLMIREGILYSARSNGRVHRLRLSDRQVLEPFAIAVNVFNLSYEGQDFCVSLNTDAVYCYSFCEDPAQPQAEGQQLLTPLNTPLNITLSGTDPGNRALTYELVARPLHGSLTGTGANLTYSPILDYVGVDNFTFKVNNGLQDSRTVIVTISILPELLEQPACVLANTPTYRGRAVELNTRSHGGGYSPAFGEYWYPNWDGNQITRYSGDRDYVGLFRTGRDRVMQLWGESDGTYYTANWNSRAVARWQGLSANLLWSTSLPGTVGGVSAEGNFVYAMDSEAPTVWKLRKADGVLVETITVPAMPGVLYGGLAALDGDLLVGREDGIVRRVDLDTREIVSTFTTAVPIQNMSFNGVDYCVSNNSNQIHCYAVCGNSQNRPPFLAQIDDRDDSEGDTIAATLEATDDDNDPLQWSATNLPPGLSINATTGVISGVIADGALDNSPYTVTITVSDGVDEVSTQFEWTTYDPDLPAPTLANRTPGNTWITVDDFVIRGQIVDNDCPRQPVVFVQGRNLPTTTSEVNGEWFLETERLAGEGTYNFGIRLQSFCSGKIAVEPVGIAVENTPPTMNFLSGAPSGVLGQSGVDAMDLGTWPLLSGAAEVPMQALLQDDLSGIKRSTATIVPVIDDNGVPTPQEGDAALVYDQTFPLTNQAPMTGPLSRAAVMCSVPANCAAGKLLVRTLTGSHFELRLTVEDHASHTVRQTFRFGTIDLAEAIRRWRQAIADHGVSDAQADPLRLQARQKLDLALLALEEGQSGNLALALEDAAGDLAQALAHEPTLDTTDASILVGRLATAYFTNLLGQAVSDHGPHNSFTRADEFLDRSNSNLDFGGPNAARSAFLDLANAWFWLEDGREPLLAISYPSALEVLDLILARMDAYIAHEPQLPGVTALMEARVELGEVRDYIELVILRGAEALTDLEHVEAIQSMTNAAESLKLSEESTAWIRQYQWGLTQIVYIFVERGLNNITTFLGRRHPIVAYGYDSLEEADEYRAEFRADDFMSLLIDSRCLVLGLYNLTYEPDVNVPEHCCELMREYRALDDGIPLTTCAP